MHFNVRKINSIKDDYMYTNDIKEKKISTKVYGHLC